MTIDLRPCPCCGLPAKVDTIRIRARRAKTWRETFAIKCTAQTPCVSTYDAGGAFGSFETPEQAAAQWNRRNGADASPDLLAALEALMQAEEARSWGVFGVDREAPIAAARAAIAKARGTA